MTDLNAIELGDKVVVTFNTPARTTDGVAITKFSNIDLRVGTDEQNPDQAKSYDVPLPQPGDREDPQPKYIVYSLNVTDWSGKHIAVAVRTSVRKNDHFSDWSKRATLDVIPPLAQPVVHAEGSATGIALTWPPSDDAQYRISRQAASEKQPLDLATVNQPAYVDVSAQYDTPYTYIVTAVKGKAESMPSEPASITAKDIYPPAVPTGLSIVAGPDSVNLAWQRNMESDFQGYYIFRSANNGPYQRQGSMIALPTFVDRNVEHGSTYSYRISAIDKKNNESAQSSPAEVQY